MKNVNYKNIKSIEDACRAKNVPVVLPDAKDFPEEYRRHVLLHYVIMVVTGAVNGDWVPDFKNKKQHNYQVWLWIDESGVGFSDVDYVYSRTNSRVGARLVLETAAQARYVGNLIKDTFADYCLKY
jgi:hypothetical protein